MLVKHRKTVIFNFFYRYYELPENHFVFVTYLFSPFIFFIVKFGGFKLFFIYYLLITLFISFRLKRIFAPFLLSYIFTLQYLNPAKSYPVMVISKFKEVVLDYKLGYLKDYSLNTSNIFLIITMAIAIRMLIINRKYINLFKDSKLLLTVFSFVAFFVCGYLSSYNMSPYFTASFFWLLQYSQLYLVAILIYILYKLNRRDYSLLIYVVVSSVLLQTIVSFIQFIRQSSLGLIFERGQLVQWSVGDLDMIGNLYRVYGSFSHPNELGLIMVLLLCVIFPYVSKKNAKIYHFAAILGGVVVLLTQSRSAWIGLFLSVVILIRQYYYKINALLHTITTNRRIIIYSSIILVLLSYVVIPRILLSTTIFSKSGALEIRVDMLRESREAIKLSPLIGFGVGTNESILYELFPRGFMRDFPSAVHTGFIQLILEVGIFGFVAFILPFVVVFYLQLRNIFLGDYINQDNKRHIYTYISGIIVFCMYYLFQPHWGQYDFAYLGIILGIGLVSLSNYEKKHS